MSDAWKSYRGAPTEGTVVGRVAEVPDGAVKCVKLNTGQTDFPVLIVRARGQLRAFVNACPHQYLPLDHRGDQILSADGTMLRCTNHGASFRIADGRGVEGLAAGSRLDEIPIVVGEDGEIRIAASE